MAIKSLGEAGVGETSLKVAGMGFVSLLTTLAGLIFIILGLVLGALYGMALGGMVALLIGIASIVVATLTKDER